MNLEYDYGDYAGKDSGAAVGVQWKGTDVCFDFYCECGRDSHFDGYGAYAVRCGHCGKKFDMPYTLHLKPFTGVFEPVEAWTYDD